LQKALVAYPAEGLSITNEIEVHDMSVLPALVAKAYKTIIAYGNHFRVTTWPGTTNMVTYDSGVLGEFEHTPSPTRTNPNPTHEQVTCVGECKEILKLDYEATRVPILLCSWVRATTCCHEKKEFGFTLVHFRRLLPT
jgi:hypothetical protein